MTTLETPHIEEIAEDAVAARRPYKGLDFYTSSEEDARLFVGRDTERKLIASNLIASRLTIVYGASGVGKSSLLNAGVAYQLRHDADLNERGAPEYVVVVHAAWRDDPVTGLVDAVAREVKKVLPEPAAAVEPGLPLAEALRQWGAMLDGELLVILDQFEEFFLYHGEETGDAGFGAQLAEAIDNPAVHANFLLSIREDALGRLDLFKDRIPNLFENSLRLDHLGLEAGREAIEQPLEEWNKLATTDEPVSIEKGLVDDVLDQVRTVELGNEGLGAVDIAAPVSQRTRIEAPYLQIVLTRLWSAERALNSNVLRLETLRTLGGAQKIVDARVQEAMGSLSAEQQVVAAAVCHYLVSRTGTKIAFGAADLADFSGLQEAEVADVLEQLTKQKARILRPIAPPADQPGGTRYELFHDKLAKAILEWRASFLERQARIAAERQLKEEQDDRQRELRNKVIRWAAVALVVVVVALVALSAVALHRGSVASSAEHDAASRYFAARAAGELSIAPAVGVRLAADGMNVRVTDEAEQAFREALQASHLRAVLTSGRGPIYGASMSSDGKRIVTVGDGSTPAYVWDVSSGRRVAVLQPPKAEVWTARFSPDGKRVVTAGPGGPARVWDLSSGKSTPLLPSLGAPLDASFSPNGKRIVTAGFDGPATLFDASSGRMLGLLHAQARQMWSMSFSRDSRRILAITDHSTVVVWDAATGLQLAVLRGHTGRIWAASFSPDGNRIVTASADHTARIWDAATGRSLITLSGGSGEVYAASFSPDGKLVVTGNADHTAHIWNASTGRNRAILSGDTGSIFDAGFSPNGKLVVTASADHTARVWDAASGKSVALLGGDSGAVYTASFGGHGKLIVTASADGSTRVWNVSSTPLVATLADSPTAAIFSPNDKLVVTMSTDGARVWNVSSRKKVATLRGDGTAVLTAIFSPDKKRLMVAAADGTVRAWDVSNWHRVDVVHTQAGSVAAAAFSPDDTRLVTGGPDGARIWDTSSGKRLAVLRGQTGTVTAVGFSPDGKRVVTTGDDGTARIWDASTGTILTMLGGRQAKSASGGAPAAAPVVGTAGGAGSAPALRWAAFSPDGKLVATSGDDSITRVWDASSGARRATLIGDTQSVSSVSFSPGGRLILTASADGTARVWETSNWQSLAILGSDSGPVYSASYAPDGEFIVTTNGDGKTRIYRCRFCASRSELAALARTVKR